MTFLICLAPIADTSYPPQWRASIGFLLVVVELIAVRQGLACVVVSCEGVAVKNIYRNYRFTWEEIDGFELIPGFAGRLRKMDGTRLSVRGLGVTRIGTARALRRDAPFVEWLNELVMLAKSNDKAGLEARIRSGTT
ncbi:MAG: hypothetical protein ACRDZR_06760 [Acidimicrobiales bacterium]